MQAYRVKTRVASDSSVNLRNLPFQEGEAVEVIILPVSNGLSVSHERYPLRGTPVTYIEPFEPVADAEWESAR